MACEDQENDSPEKLESTTEASSTASQKQNPPNVAGNFMGTDQMFMGSPYVILMHPAAFAQWYNQAPPYMPPPMPYYPPYAPQAQYAPQQQAQPQPHHAPKPEAKDEHKADDKHECNCHDKKHEPGPFDGIFNLFGDMIDQNPRLSAVTKMASSTGNDFMKGILAGAGIAMLVSSEPVRNAMMDIISSTIGSFASEDATEAGPMTNTETAAQEAPEVKPTESVKPTAEDNPAKTKTKRTTKKTETIQKEDEQT